MLSDSYQNVIWPLGAGRDSVLKRRLQQSSGRQINYPGEVPALRVDELRRIRARGVAALQDLLQGFGLALTGDQEGHRPRRVQDRYRKGQPRGPELEHRVGDDPPVGNVESPGLREQAPRVTILPKASEDEVEPRDIIRSEELAQLPLVGCGCLLGGQLAAHPVDASYAYVREEGLAGHPVVRVLVIGGDGTLVPEEDVDLAPVEFVGVVPGQHLVGGLRGRSSGERYGETASFINGLPGPGGEVARGGLGELLRRLVDEEIHSSSIATAARRAFS